MLDLKDADIDIACQLIDTTHEEECPTGPVHTEVYYVQLTLPCGRRFMHNYQSRNGKKIQVLAIRIGANRHKINLAENWTETAPMYGSEAYIKGGGDAAYGHWDKDERAAGQHIKAAMAAGCNPSPYGQD